MEQISKPNVIHLKQMDETPQFKTMGRDIRGKKTKINIKKEDKVKGKNKSFYPSYTVGGLGKKEIREISNAYHHHNEKYCYGCSEKIREDEDYLSIENNIYHQNCFKCQGENCSKNLGKIEFYDLEGMYYCGTCYFEFEKHICYHCKLIIRDEKYIKLPNKKYFHISHFKCFKCGQRIPDIISNQNEAFIRDFRDNDNSDLDSTENSIEESLNELAENDIKSLQTKKTKNENNFEFAWFNDAPCCLNCFGDIGLRCYRCKMYIEDEYLNLDEGRFHTNCIVCNICQEVIESCICKVEGKFYHSECYMKNYNKCGFCEEFILDQEYYEFRHKVNIPI